MIAARPTTYNGIRMRSRLEAAFAARLDASDYHIPWRYEPECFATSTGQYLPDFELIVEHPNGYTPRFFIEIKPEGADINAAAARMKIIHQSIPDAQLNVLVGKGYPPTFGVAWAMKMSPDAEVDHVATLRNAAIVTWKSPSYRFERAS